VSSGESVRLEHRRSGDGFIEPAEILSALPRLLWPAAIRVDLERAAARGDGFVEAA